MLSIREIWEEAWNKMPGVEHSIFKRWEKAKHPENTIFSLDRKGKLRKDRRTRETAGKDERSGEMIQWNIYIILKTIFWFWVTVKIEFKSDWANGETILNEIRKVKIATPETWTEGQGNHGTWVTDLLPCFNVRGITSQRERIRIFQSIQKGYMKI